MLMRWGPLGEMTLTRRMMEWVWEPMTWLAEPDVEMLRTRDGIAVRVSLPGIRPEDVAVEVRGDWLTLRAQVREERTADRFGWTVRERRAGLWERRLRLPFRVDARRARAELTGGVLTVRLPRAEGFWSRLKRRVRRQLRPPRRVVRIKVAKA